MTAMHRERIVDRALAFAVVRDWEECVVRRAYGDGGSGDDGGGGGGGGGSGGDGGGSGGGSGDDDGGRVGVADDLVGDGVFAGVTYVGWAAQHYRCSRCFRSRHVCSCLP